jgi:hypothetical protein
VSRAASTAICVAVALAVLVTGCGSSSLSTAALRTRATRICRAANARAARIPTPALPDESAAFLRQSVTTLGAEHTALRRLRPTAEARPVYTEALDQFGQEIALLRDALTGLTHGGDPVSTVATLQRHLAPLEVKENAAWDKLEIGACAAG